MIRPLVVGIALAALFAASAGPSAADRAGAEFYAQRGEKALRERDWSGATEEFRKATEEDATFALAHGGLGEALLGAGDRGGALVALRKAVSVAEAARPMPQAWTAPLARYRKRLAEIDTLGVALDKLVDKYAADLGSFVDRWAAKDPDTAAAALQDLARVKPGDPRMKALTAKVQKGEAAAWIPLFNGKDKAGWDWLEAKEWSVVQGVLVGAIDSKTLIARTKETYRGDFDIRMEAKLVFRPGATSGFFLLGALEREYRHSSFGILGPNLVWQEETGPKDAETRLSTAPAQVDPPFDPDDWTVYEMRFRGERVHAVVNGTVVGTFPRAAGREGGAVGLKIQNVQAQFRRIELRLR